jgi:uncharacterized protein YggE
VRFTNVAAAAIVVAVLLALPAAAATQDVRTIVVAASGSVSALSSPAQWTIGISVTYDSARGALRTSAATMLRIRSALERAGVPAAELTVSTQVSPHMQDELGSFDAFVVTKTVDLTIENPRRAALLIDKATAAGGNYVDGPSLAQAQNDDLIGRAVAVAVANARVKAEALARSMGVTLGPILAVENGFTYDGLDPLEGEVYATVAVEFAVEPQ